MRTQIYWLLEVAINPGKLEAFRSVAKDLIAATEKEAGTLGYQWNLNEDETVCHIYERYTDSAAMLIHVQSFGKYAARFMQACRPTRFDFYGNPSEEAKAALADLHPTFFKPLGGFNR